MRREKKNIYSLVNAQKNYTQNQPEERLKMKRKKIGIIIIHT